MSDTMPKYTLRWGIALALAGGVLAAFVQPVLYSSGWLNTEPGGTFLYLGLLVLDLLNTLVIPLGTALIAASLVMFYIRGRSRPAEADRPKRWVLPEPLDRRPER